MKEILVLTKINQGLQKNRSKSKKIGQNLVGNSRDIPDMTNVARKNDGYCNNCPRDNLPRKQLSKGLLSNVTVVQADYCPRRLLSKEAFTSKKLAQIDFSFFY